MSPSNRRTALRRFGASLAASVGIGLAGCFKEVTPEDDSPTQEHTASSEATPVDGTEEPLLYSFHLTNFEESGFCANLTVTAEGAETPILDGTYHLPPRTGLEFFDVAAVGNRYTVECELSDGRSLTETWPAERCPEEYGGVNSDMDGAIHIKDGSFILAWNQCDAITVGIAPFSYTVNPRPGDCSL
jgi:hypothetical protein